MNPLQRPLESSSAADAGAIQLAKPAGNGPRRLRPVSEDRPAGASVGRTQSTRLEFPSRGRRGHQSERRCAAKLAALLEVLRATDRDSVYDIKVMAVPLAAVALHARAIILISEPALTLLDANELQALVAHEVGHEYISAERERAFLLADHSRLKDLELICDAIAVVTLHGLGMDVSRLMAGLEKISRFNRKQFGTADNEKDYPTVAERGAFAAAVAAWIVR